MRLIDADELPKVKFHALPYTHIVPSDLKGLQTEAYERGWNDAIDAIVENAETADVSERSVGKWIEEIGMLMCSECGDAWGTQQFDEVMSFNFCPNCGADMRERREDAEVH